MDELPLDFHGGLHLKDSVLWLDAEEPRPLSFVSHAAVAGAQGHQKILSSAQTADLLRALASTYGRGRKVHEPQALVTPYGRPFVLGQLSLELFPSGHVLGSASLLIRLGELDIVYAGEINPRRSQMAERLEVRPCDILALPCRFGQRHFIFPDAEEVSAAILRFVGDALDHGQSAVLLCPPLGEAQEVASLLLEAGLFAHAHRKIFYLSRVYQQAGLLLEGLRRLELGTLDPPAVLLWPADLPLSPMLERLGSRRTALVSGAALDPQVRARTNCDAGFALSAHADHSGLLKYVKACGAGRVVLLCAPGSDLEQDLQGMGVATSCLAPPRQMPLF